MDFTNKTVLVTGSSRGIGKAIAFAFGRAGARVVLNASRSKDQLAEAKKELEEMGVSCMAILADVSDYNACKDMFLQIQDAFGPVDILVNNAGISHIGLFTDMTPEQWQHVLNVNLGSVLNCTHLAVPAMVHNKKGVILNISSGIRVNAIACGVIDTEMNACFSEEERAELADEIALMRFGRPEEVGRFALTLASESASFLTGQIITLDGGML